LNWCRRDESPEF